jgi:hypothetical protein
MQSDIFFFILFSKQIYGASILAGKIKILCALVLASLYILPIQVNKTKGKRKDKKTNMRSLWNKNYR